MATKKPPQDSGEISIIEIQTGTITVAVVGTTPLILNRLAEKAKHELLLPAPRKTAADKASNLKHNPLDEFRASPVRLRDPGAPTLLALPATAFKGALRTAALDLPGAKKSQIGRLTYIPGEYVPIYGIPQVYSTIVRAADMNRTPDVRTRCIVPKWAAVLSITFVRPLMREQAIANLLAAAGLTVGVGDFRPEKGAGTYGQFSVVGADDPQLQEIMQTGGRAAQEAAMQDPEAYDDDTAELLAWFDVEVRRRGFKVAA
jgi:hypothetical protein